MHRFVRAHRFWWRKPLVLASGQAIPAELAVLAEEVRTNQCGVWLNSRGRVSGVVDLVPFLGSKGPTYRTRRSPLPLFVAAELEDIDRRAKLAKGCPDLVVLRSDRETFRLVEVKCPHWDKLSAEQERFIGVARRRGISTHVAEWEFGDDAA